MRTDPTDPLFVVRYRTKGGARCERRVADDLIWKLVKAIGRRTGVRQLHPHAFRHGCGTELLKRSRNLRAVQLHLRHTDIQTTTRYTRLTHTQLKEVVLTARAGNPRYLPHDERRLASKIFITAPSLSRSTGFCKNASNDSVITYV